MPRPAYIICCASGALDEYTKTVSCFQLLDMVQVNRIPATVTAQLATETGKSPVIVAKPFSFVVFAAWYRNDDDTPDQVYEGQVFGRFRHLNSDLFTSIFPPFSFTKRFHRLVITKAEFPGLPDIGELVVEGRIRRQGEEEWIASQTYSIFIEPEAPPQSPPITEQNGKHQ